MLDLCIRVEDVNTYNNILMDSLLRYYQDLGRAKKRKRKGISQRHKLIQKFAKIKIWSKFDIQLSFSLFPFLPFHFLSVYFCFYNFFFFMMRLSCDIYLRRLVPKNITHNCTSDHIHFRGESNEKTWENKFSLVPMKTPCLCFYKVS